MKSPKTSDQKVLAKSSAHEIVRLIEEGTITIRERGHGAYLDKWPEKPASFVTAANMIADIEANDAVRVPRRTKGMNIETLIFDHESNIRAKRDEILRSLADQLMESVEGRPKAGRWRIVRPIK